MADNSSNHTYDHSFNKPFNIVRIPVTDYAATCPPAIKRFNGFLRRFIQDIDKQTKELDRKYANKRIQHDAQDVQAPFLRNNCA